MNIKPSEVFKDIKIISPSIFKDERGEFVETFNIEAYNFYNTTNEKIIFKEDDISISYKNVLRGLHGNTKTWKLIQCIYGEVFFVVVNNNIHSPYYLKTETLVLNDNNRLQVLIPPYYANGYLCMSDKCIFAYKQSECYLGKEEQFTLKWNDPKLKINWPIVNPIISERDNNAELLK